MTPRSSAILESGWCDVRDDYSSGDSQPRIGPELFGEGPRRRVREAVTWVQGWLGPLRQAAAQLTRIGGNQSSSTDDAEFDIIPLVAVRIPHAGDQPDWISEVAADPATARDYLALHNIEASARDTVQLARKHYPPGSTVSVTVEGDGESDGEWLIVHATVSAPRQDVSGYFNRFVDKWMSAVSLEAQDRIRLTYSAR